MSTDASPAETKLYPPPEELARSAHVAGRAAYDRLNVHDDQFDMAEALMSIGIALFGVTALTQKRALLVTALIPRTLQREEVRTGAAVYRAMDSAMSTMAQALRRGDRMRAERGLEKARALQPRVVHVDEQNRVIKIGNDAAEPVPGSDQLRGDLLAAD